MSLCRLLACQVIFLSFLSVLPGCNQDDASTDENIPDTVFEQDTVTTDYTSAAFTSGIEGPVVDGDGNLYVVNINEQGTIGVVDTSGIGTLFVTLPSGSIGNGLRFSKDYKTLFVADYVNHQVLQVEMATRDISVFAAADDRLNQPNDIAISSKGVIYASDPNWGNSTGNLWIVSTNGEFELVEDSMGTTNGVEVSPNDEKLYVNESVQRRIWVYDIDEDGNPVNKQLFHEFTDFGLDGMRCDEEGNLYVARFGKGTVAVINPDGELKFEVKLSGKNPTNVAFGGADGRTCYVTIQDRKLVERFRNAIPGRSFMIE